MSKTRWEYSQEELKEMIKKMTEITMAFYPAATRTGNHAFIEFCGLMGEYIKMCEYSLEHDVSFAEANTHSGVPLVAANYQIQYLAEKFDCIFGPLLKNPVNRKLFFEKMGWEEQVIFTTPTAK